MTVPQVSHVLATQVLAELPSHEPGAQASFALSVLVPVYNERHVVEASLKRLLKLQHPLIKSLQVIVVDDCSTDGTRDILRKVADSDSRVVLMQHERNAG